MDDTKILTLAVECGNNGDYAKSCSFYLLAFENDSTNQCCLHNKEHFLLVFKKWLTTLMILGRQEEFSKFLQMVFDMSPPLKADVVLIASGILYEHEYVYDASKLLLSCYDKTSINYEIKENLEQLYNILVDRWHFRMLNDKRRNLAYYCALCKAFKSGYKNVLDIGSGTGLLSMLARKAGFTNISSCDVSEVMCDLQQKILSINECHGVNVINKMSTSLDIPLDINDRVDLVVTEVFDCGLLGEKVIPTVLHAWQNLMIPDKSRIIPGSAILMGVIVECEELRRHSVFQSENGTFVYGTKEIDEEENDQVYTTENMRTIRNGYTKLTDSFVIQNFDFNNPKELEALLNKKFRLSIPRICDGKADAVVTYFTLMLDDSISICTGPEENRGCCWEQAVYDVCHLQSCSKTGKDLSLDFIIHPEKVIIETPNSPIEKMLKADRRLVARLNDQVYWLKYREAITNAFRTISHHKSHLKICIMCSDISQLPVIAASVHDSVHNIKEGSCTLYILEPSELLLMYSCKEMISIKEKIVVFDKAFITSEENVKDLIFDLVLCEPIDHNGLMKEQFIEDLTIVKSMCCSEETIFIPSSIEVVCTMIHSTQLSIEHRLLGDHVTLDLKIADVINQYKVSTHPDLDMNAIGYSDVSNVVTCERMKLDKPINDSKEAQIFNVLNKVVNVNLKKSIEASANEATAVMYWFNILFTDNITIETSPSCNGHWKQACYMLTNQISLPANETIHLNYTRNKSNIHYHLDALSE